MESKKTILRSMRSMALVALLLLAGGAKADLTQLATSPLSGASSVDIEPNILFVLDDSGSMDLDYLPDWAGLTIHADGDPAGEVPPLHQSKNPGFNGIAYNPTVTYTPPKYFDVNGAVDTATYPTQTSLNTIGWTAVRYDGYGVQDKAPNPTSSNLVGVAYYFTTVPGEYCTNASMKTCIAADAPSNTYPVPAKLRWCKTAEAAAAATPAAGDCQATQIEPRPAPHKAATNIPFTSPRMPAPRDSTVSIVGGSSTSVSSITVDGQEILSAAIAETSDSATMAGAIEIAINACTFGLTGNCGIVGYRAVAVGSMVVISAPGVTNSTPVITKLGSMSLTPTAFARPATNLAPGENLLTVITSPTASYPRATGRSDCAADPCTYAEEMTNYANWWAYYHTRMQTMKTAASLSFDPIDKAYRVGYMSINNITGTDFQNIATFDAVQKRAWYDKLFAAIPGLNTPLRVALSKAGRLYAGRLNGSTFNGATVIDPVQYYCQQNVTILSTDGYWNEGAGYQWDGETLVGDQDGPNLEVRPQLDGGSSQLQQATRQVTRTRTPDPRTQKQTKTEQLQSQTAQWETRTFTQPQASTAQLQSQDAQWQSSTSTLQISTFTQQQIRTLNQPQEQVSQLQYRDGVLQSRRSDLQTRTKTQDQQRTSQLQSLTALIESKTYQLQQRLTQVQERTSSNSGATWTGWSNVATCSPQLSGVNRVGCQIMPPSDWKDVSSCAVVVGGTVVTDRDSDLERTTHTTDSQCQYTSPSWTSVTACTAVAKSPGPNNYTVGTAVDCQMTWPTTWNDVSSCTTSTTVACRYADWTAYKAVDSCTAQPKSGGSPYTVGVAAECGADDWTLWSTTTATCTSSSTVQCKYVLATGWINAASCTALLPSESSPYSVTQAWECRVNYGNWKNVAAASSCIIDDEGRDQRQCRYDAYTDWKNVAACTPADRSTSSPYTVTQARNCQTVWSAFTDTVSCTPSPTTECQTAWTADKPVASCTAEKDKTKCHYTAWSNWSNVASCTPLDQSPGPEFTVGTARQCQTIWPNPWVDAASCTVSPSRLCQYAASSPWVDVDSCTSVEPSVKSPYTVGVATSCQKNWTGWSPTASCTEVPDEVQCRPTWPDIWLDAASCTRGPTTDCRQDARITSWTDVAACSPGTDANGLTTFCQDVTVTDPPTVDFVDPNPPDPYQDEAPSAENGFVATTYTTATSGPTDVAFCSPIAPVAPSFLETTCPARNLGPTSDTLADVAEFYWKTDLRDPELLPAYPTEGPACTGGPVIVGDVTIYNDVCVNDPRSPKQFMKTYTLGLGASGLMQYQKDYLTATSGDFFSIAQGSLADPATGVCPWQSVGECNWPKPESNTQTNIDDLWHAAVNGRGTYFSASNPSSLAAGISGALANVTVRDGALAAVSVSSANLESDANAVFEVAFRAGEWSGDVTRRTIDGTGVLAAETTWSAQVQLDILVANGTHTARTIYMRNPDGESVDAAADDLKFFLWDNLTPDEQAYFATTAINTLTQFCENGTICLSETTQANASYEPLLNFVRGDKTNEGPLADISVYYRERPHLLGDIVGSEATYVQKSPWNYADYNYGAFRTANQSRTAMVYIGANDGMLHAFDALTGNEVWAYVPTMVMPTLFKLADKNYGAPSRHQFFVDATPVVGDICVSDCTAPPSGDLPTVWKTILVGGLNNGGRGYYALDVTNPAAPKSLWEFTDDNLGYTYGNPLITKLKDGTWVVMVTSGYNNVAPGDGSGRLFILDANTGALIRSINTGVGTTSTPSGLGRIAGWANFPDNNNTAQRVYGGDLLGNLWRFDVNGDIPLLADPPVYDAQRLATLLDPDGVPQPITSKPELGKIEAYPVVFIGTGQLLGSNDLVSTQTNSLYAIKDRLTDTDYGSPRPLSPAQTDPTPGDFVAQTLTSAICPAESVYCTAGDAIVTASNNAVDFNVNDGWYIDFPVAGERLNTDLRLQLGTLAFNTNTPTTGACVPVGVSFTYFLNYRSGGYVEGTSLLGVRLGDYLSTAPSVVRLIDGTIRGLIRTDEPGTISSPIPFSPGPLDTRRVSWRELVNE